MNSLLMHPWFTRFWSFAGAVSVRAKILGIMLALVLLLGLGVTVQVRQSLTRTMEAQMAEQSASVARDLAARSVDMILINDLYALHLLLKETQHNNSNVRYAFIVSTEGQLLGQTFGEGFPAGLLDANTAKPDEHHHTVVLNTEEGLVWDTAVPIFEGQAGTARVGLSEMNLRQAVNAVTAQILVSTILVSAIGITSAALLTWVLTRPITRLVQATQAVGRGDFTQHVPRWADDEIGDLADAFNAMAEALAKAEEERSEREQLRVRYVSGVILAQEEERKRIARELHDSTSQSLTSLLIGIRSLSDSCSDSEVRLHAEELRAIAAQTLDEVHDLALQLRPSVLDDLGLQAAVERYVAECQSRYHLQVDLAIRGFNEHRLSSEIETALYRIIQEALTNVVRHAQAQTTSVLLELRSGALRAIIEDDGLGFDPHTSGTAGRHLGLYGIRERAELLGGKVTVESEPGHGTSLFIEIPLPAVITAEEVISNGVTHVQNQDSAG